MIRLAIVVALFLAACGGAAVPPAASAPSTPVVPVATATVAPSPSPSPAPTPTATPAPTPTPSLSPTPKPTPVPKPTFTADDIKLSTLIKDGVAATLDKLGRIDSTSSLTEILDTFRDLSTFADNQATKADIYMPSACTAGAVLQFKSGMNAMKAVADGFLDWVAGGQVGDPPGGASEAGQTLRTSLDALEASRC